MLRLYTFQISHYAEKARWALDHKRIPYEERRLLPGPHMAITRRLGRKTSVPLLVDGRGVVQGSKEIIDFVDERWPDRSLTPESGDDRARSLELEVWLDRELGETLRRVFYFHSLKQPDVVVDLFTQNGPSWGRMCYRVAFGFVAGRIRAMYKVTAETAAKDRERLAQAIARVDELLAGKSHLVGERFTRADLTVAALLAPMFRPAEHSTRWPAESLAPPEIRDVQAQFGKTRTREHVLRMYREHRQSTA
jgi:glutathione S-transferase